MSRQQNKGIMGELRQDRISGEWVVIAPWRSLRPRPMAEMRRDQSSQETDPTCPFCPSNEDQLPGILTEYQGDDPSGWSVRVVPNKYAAFTADPAATSQDLGFVTSPSFGFQEVIIESPQHNADLTTLSDKEMLAVMRAYRERFAALMQREGVTCVTLFRNYGPWSGASLAHPHSQLIATGFIPQKLKSLDERARRYFKENSACIVCDELRQEMGSSSRIIEFNDGFAAFVPFAAQYPSELWIIPARHQACFGEISDGELEALGLLLRQSLRQLSAVHGDISYNFVIESANRDGSGVPYLHWRLRIAPGLAHWGGFELGTGVPINPSSPEEDAAALRSGDGT
jgi:UDPglucose--hexose-1-phosphate uridylyltransferase